MNIFEFEATSGNFDEDLKLNNFRLVKEVKLDKEPVENLVEAKPPSGPTLETDQGSESPLKLTNLKLVLGSLVLEVELSKPTEVPAEYLPLSCCP